MSRFDFNETGPRATDLVTQVGHQRHDAGIHRIEDLCGDIRGNDIDVGRIVASTATQKQVEENQKFSSFVNKTKLFSSYRIPTEDEIELINKVSERDIYNSSVNHPVLYNNVRLFIQFERRGTFTYCYLLSYRPEEGKSELRVGVTVISGKDLFNGYDNQQVANNIALARAVRSEPILKL